MQLHLQERSHKWLGKTTRERRTSEAWCGLGTLEMVLLVACWTERPASQVLGWYKRQALGSLHKKVEVLTGAQYY